MARIQGINMLEAVKRLYEEANHFFLLGQYKLAIECYDKVLELNPDYEAVKKQRLITYCSQVQELFDSENYSSVIQFVN